ncbi:MAG: type II secretion system F family protein [Sulfuricurvum sp.]|nr:type II secretion system F family protein [Sulfuricurvum sp.]
MDGLGWYFVSVFLLVSATVYLVLARQKKGGGAAEGSAGGQSWNDFYAQYAQQGNVQNLIKQQQDVLPLKRVREWIDKKRESLFREHVSYETEVLFFAMQFLMYMESGMTVMSALQKTQSAMENAGYRMAQELQKLNFKLRSGVPFAEAIHMLEGKEVKIVKEFFLVISQAQEIGVAVSDALKSAIKEFEELRVIRAEERASRLSVLLAVPIVFGFLPAILLLVLTPAVHGLMGALK